MADVPAEIVDVARTLHAAGHAAVLVGGAIRDVLLGREAADWDLASSARPEEVQAAFARTVPTGIEHGTVSVLVRAPAEDAWIPVEVTTFRGEGTYVDGRRPSEVTFLRDLEDDLARRDFTVNALAWDPIDEVFSDPFGGLEDLRIGVLRAVGDASRRFIEDGLRTMRAVRFCATRSLTLEAATEAAIADALDVFDKVSAERVLVELTKLLEAPSPSRGLMPMRATGLWSHVLPPPPASAWDETIAAVDAMPPAFATRLARLLRPVAADAAGRTAVVDAVEALKPSRTLRADVIAWTSASMDALEAALSPVDAVAVRRGAADLTRARLDGALDVLGASASTRAAALEAVRDAPLSVGELALKGGALIGKGVLAPGPAVGETMRELLAWTLEDPSRNRADALLERARALTT